MRAYEEIGRRLQKAREEAKLSQEELAKRIGCSQSALSCYELGKRRLYFAELGKISTILNRPIAYFLQSIDGNDSCENDFNKMLDKPYLKEILLNASELTSEKRKSVLEYIQWQKSKGSNDI